MVKWEIRHNAAAPACTTGFVQQNDIAGAEHVLDHFQIETPTRDDLQKFFTKGELEAYWNRLTSARKKKSMSVEDAWKGLKAMTKEDAEKTRWVTLSDYIRKPDGQDWHENLITITDQFTKSRKLRISKDEFYKEELEVKHGKAEAAAFIAKGKYREKKDEQGDTFYVKVRKEEILEKERRQTADLQRSFKRERYREREGERKR